MRLLSKISAGLTASVLAISLFSCGGWKEVTPSEFVKEVANIEKSDATKAKVVVEVSGNDEESKKDISAGTYEFNITRVGELVTFVPTEVNLKSTAVASILTTYKLSFFKEAAQNYKDSTQTVTGDSEIEGYKFYIGNGYKIASTYTDETKDGDKVVAYEKNEGTSEFNKAGLLTYYSETSKSKKEGKDELWATMVAKVTYSK